MIKKVKSLIINKRAKFDYEILESFEAGIVLTGKEVKSLKNKRGKLEGAYGHVQGGELFIINLYISPYQPKNVMGETTPDRTRKILLKKKEIKYLIGKIKERGLTLVPLKIYTKSNRIKIELGLGKGKSKADKRETIKRREARREVEREIKKSN